MISDVLGIMLETRSQGVSSTLHARGQAAWAAATGHPMVREIGAGTLARETFRRYFEQNILYLEEYARAIALIIGKAPNREAIGLLSRFLSRIVQEEIPSNGAFLERLGGDPAQLDPVTMNSVTYGYTRHLLYVAAQGDCAEGLAAVLPCQWSYGELAKPFARSLPADPIYADWIGLFANAQYDSLVALTTGLLDAIVDPNDQRKMAILERIFQISIGYEVQFWDMAYRTDMS